MEDLYEAGNFIVDIDSVSSGALVIYGNFVNHVEDSR